MYIPEFFAEKDETKILAFMREFNFATVISAKNELPFATHIPFIVEKRDTKIIISGHLAKANEQWKQFDKVVLVIFRGPHAYISPILYLEPQNVPTWNYVAVHAYGTVKIFDEAENLALIEKQLEIFDLEYFQTMWREIPLELKSNLAKGVVAFEIEVMELQAKSKLNQNKPGKTAENVIEAFEQSDHENERLIAEYMKEFHGTT
ncbi:MAG: FMN-binding negative transcriptional regulator [Pyrinomonadaceae bacterium]